ncbi:MULTISPECIES: hypothetical protein [unclassified Microbacterium]|uniref:hypothetical protein n=1 Tax=unclassified Microbacterium TaxID=2609290 RepID=UPI00160538B0|nr:MULTISPECIES: hypothetical protein [unclassified Microbacterium]QNA93994.1 hypothetical protein G4G29_20155 [Microbacterium sp. Se63.02b]QYM64324.1 hypothetical protein K1X59_20205 [Microbacterium sp. Se5.02b]
MINRIRWIILCAIILTALAFLIARQQGAITDFVTSVVMCVLIALATTVGLVASSLLRRERRERR